MATLTLPLPTGKNQIFSYLIAGDWHTDHMCQNTYRFLVEIAKQQKIKRLIINGDFLDADHFFSKSPLFKKWLKRSDRMEEFFLPQSEKEIAWGNMVLDELQQWFEEIIFIEGNHDWRYQNFNRMIDHAYHHNFDIQHQLKLKERGIKFVHYNDWVDIGKCSVTHGMYHGTSACKKHYEACGQSVIFSHVHQEELKSFARRGDTCQSQSIGAMCELNPYYIKNSESNWVKGFCTLHVRRTGQFNVYKYTNYGEMMVMPNGTIIR